MNDLVFIILLSLLPACFSYFLDYCLGHPMADDPKTKEIFSRYSLWMAKRVLKNRDLLEPIRKSFYEMLNSDDPGVRRDGIEQMKKTIMLEGAKYYNIEKAFGMCPYCTNFWFSQMAALGFYFLIPLALFNPLVYFIMIPIFSHSILRKL